MPAAGERPLRNLPSPIDRLGEIVPRLRAGRPAVFLDYDGTLTPIVRRPSEAALDEAARAAVLDLATHCPVGVISGRDLADVRKMVGIDGISYAGGHGFDILAADGTRHRRAEEYAGALGGAAAELESALRTVPGAWIERKRFAVAVHVREVEDDLVPFVEGVTHAVAEQHPELRQTGGKRVFELRPAVPWDKGKALLELLELLGLGGADVVPVYVGDDETDEDAFVAIRTSGIGVVVRGEGDDRPTAAHYALASPAEVRVFLEALAAAL
jgi:trehalose-phosphatase